MKINKGDIITFYATGYDSKGKWCNKPIILHTSEVLKVYDKGDIVGVRGRLETYNTITDNDVKQKHMIVIAERITFLSSGIKDVKESEEDL